MGEFTTVSILISLLSSWHFIYQAVIATHQCSLSCTKCNVFPGGHYYVLILLLPSPVLRGNVVNHKGEQSCLWGSCHWQINSFVLSCFFKTLNVSIVLGHGSREGWMWCYWGFNDIIYTVNVSDPNVPTARWIFCNGSIDYWWTTKTQIPLCGANIKWQHAVGLR